MLEDDTKKELAFVYEGVFTFDIKENDNDRVVIKSIEQHLKNYKKVALYGAGQLLNYFLRYSPGFMEGIEVIVDDKEALWGTVIHDKKVIPLQELPRDIEAVFICIHQTHLVEKLINNLQKSGKSIKIETLKSLYDFDLVGLSTMTKFMRYDSSSSNSVTSMSKFSSESASNFSNPSSAISFSCLSVFTV